MGPVLGGFLYRFYEDLGLGFSGFLQEICKLGDRA